MFVLIALPFIFGHLLTTRALREGCIPLRCALTYSLGLLAFFAGVNAFFHFFALRQAVYTTLAVLGASSIALLRVPAVPAARTSFGRWEHLVLVALSLTAFFNALFWQMNQSDDDFFIHAPLMALYLRDIFPPRNPFFPDLPLFGHYGRDLTISALSTLLGERFLEVQYVVTALNHAVLVWVAHFTLRRYLRSSSQALLAVCFAYLAVNNDGRRGLLETFQNNNTFANLFLFVNIYLFLAAVTSRRTVPVLVSGLALGSYSLIYETHFSVLIIALAAFPPMVAALRRRWRLRHFVVAWSVLFTAGLLSAVQGGTLTDILRRQVIGAKARISQSEDERRMTQEIRLRFPKPGLRITSPQGEEYPLWSWRFVRESGTFVLVLPVTMSLMIVWRKPLGILLGTISIIALLVPAAVDFGAFNSESLRFLMLGGVGAAMLCGITLATTWRWVVTHWPRKRYIATACLCGILIPPFWPSVGLALQLFTRVARHPTGYYLTSEEWACSQPFDRPCMGIDIATAVALRSIARSGERTLAYVESDNPKAALLFQSLLATFSRTFVAGPGIRVVPQGSFTTGSYTYIEPLGFRAKTFWRTLDVDILDDMRVEYLFVDPGALPHDAYRRLVKEPRLERVVRQEEAGGLVTREIYRVRAPVMGSKTLNGEGIWLANVKWPAIMAARQVYPLPVVISGTDQGGALTISCRVNLRGGPQINAGDEVRQRVVFRPAGPLTWQGTFWFATPYDPGSYEVVFSAWTKDVQYPLRAAQEEQAVFKVTVRQ